VDGCPARPVASLRWAKQPGEQIVLNESIPANSRTNNWQKL